MKSTAHTAMARSKERLWKADVLWDTPLLRARYWTQEFPRHTHDTFVIAVNERGAHRSWYRGAHETLTSATLVVVNPGEVHTGGRASDEPWHYRAIYPTPETLCSVRCEMDDRTSAPPCFPLRIADRDIVDGFLAAHRLLECGHDLLAGEELMLLALGRLICRHADTAHLRNPVASSPGSITRVKEFIVANLSRQLSLGEIADAVDLGRFQVLRAFQKATGRTPHGYLMESRISRAKPLLRAGTPIARVAYALGFADQSHFTHRFRAYVGVTPGEYVAGAVDARPRQRKPRPPGTLG